MRGIGKARSQPKCEGSLAFPRSTVDQRTGGVHGNDRPLLEVPFKGKRRNPCDRFSCGIDLFLFQWDSCVCVCYRVD